MVIKRQDISNKIFLFNLCCANLRLKQKTDEQQSEVRNSLSKMVAVRYHMKLLEKNKTKNQQ